jgi:hypothetical protein
MNPNLKTSAIALAMGFSAFGALAAGSAYDTAANYSSSWSTSPPNLGTGFGSWTFTDNNSGSGPYAGTYLDQTSYNNSDGALSGGYAWGTYANGGSGNGYVDMTRNFLAGPSGSASLYNQTFSVLVGSSGIGGAGSSMSVNVGTAFSVGYAGGGSDNMFLSIDGGAASALPVAFANLNSGLQISLAVSGPLNSASEGYTLTLSPASGGPAYDVLSGTFDSLDYNTSSFTLADVNTSNDQFANNLSISPEAVPEPSTLALLAVNGAAAMAFFRRRK